MTVSSSYRHICTRDSTVTSMGLNIGDSLLSGERMLHLSSINEKAALGEIGAALMIGDGVVPVFCMPAMASRLTKNRWNV
ncbi:MAG: hypothetical protein JXJ17_18625 [Anaerolineae bacterium]|nr:hypothetical protein [Anaerolineae bacterium]